MKNRKQLKFQVRFNTKETWSKVDHGVGKKEMHVNLVLGVTDKYFL